MKKIKKPTFTVNELGNACANSIKDPIFKKNIINDLPNLVIDETCYDNLGNSNSLDFLNIANSNTTLSKDELNGLYSKTLVNNKEPRDYYDKIKSITTICPYCNTNQVTTLDHFIPKSLFPQFSITPFNLIPSCSDCNKNKLNNDAKFSHPYYDYIDDFRWLICSIIDLDNAVVTYSVCFSPNWNQRIIENVNNQFEVMKLKVLFSTLASLELANSIHKLKQLNGQGKKNLLDYLILEIQSEEQQRLNSWKVALYRALHDYFNI